MGIVTKQPFLVLLLLPPLLTVFIMLNKAKFLIDIEMSRRFWDFFLNCLSASYAC